MARGAAAALIVLALLGGAPSRAAAEAPADGADARVRAELGDLVRRRAGTRSVRYSYLTRLSAATGVVSFREPRDFNCATACAAKGLDAEIQAGTGGGSLSVGWASLVGDRKGNRYFMHEVYVGYAVRGAILRAWGEAPADARGRTFAGVEAEFAISVACFGLGVFRRVAGEPGGPEWRVQGGVGWGF